MPDAIFFEIGSKDSRCLAEDQKWQRSCSEAAGSLQNPHPFGEQVLTNFPGPSDLSGLLQTDPSSCWYVWCQSPTMTSIRNVLIRIAESDMPILLVGENGVGKRALASEIHRLSRRPTWRLLTPEELAASADSSHIQALAGNTVYVHHISELPSLSQTKLFQLFFAKGSSRSGARLIASMNCNIEGEIQRKNFRADLFYSVGGICFHIPPLRERKQDIPVLMQHFLSKYSKLLDHSFDVTQQTLHLIVQHSWPGNVTELERLIKRIAAFGDDAIAIDLLRAAADGSRHSSCNQFSLSLKQAARVASREAERELILDVLSRTRWNRKRAARELQISYKALLYKLKQIGLQDGQL